MSRFPGYRRPQKSESFKYGSLIPFPLCFRTPKMEELRTKFPTQEQKRIQDAGPSVPIMVGAIRVI
jgi:hypothetical protein